MPLERYVAGYVAGAERAERAGVAAPPPDEVAPGLLLGDQLDRLENELTAFAGRFADLARRLDPILEPLPRADGSDEPSVNVDPQLSPASARVFLLRRKLVGMGEVLGRTAERIRL